MLSVMKRSELQILSVVPKRRFRSFRRFPVVLAALLLFGGCATHSIPDDAYLEHSPSFDLETFFDGQVKAWGIVQDRKGKIVQRFIVDIEGSKQGDTLVLDETFSYSVGEGPSKRVWELKPVVQRSDGSKVTWAGKAGDILGEAKGIEYGNAFNWRYQMELPMPGSNRMITVWFDDWIWAFDQNTLMNRSYIRKFGLTFAEVTLFMQRQAGS